MKIEERQALIAQGWTPPPEPVDPDLIEVREIVARLYDVSWPERANSIRVGDQDHNVENVSALAAIKRGRELALAEAKPEMVWVKHDGSAKSPVAGHHLIVARFKVDQYIGLYNAITAKWSDITHYAIITQPEDAA